MGRENNTKSVKDLLLHARRLNRLATRSQQLSQFNRVFLSKLPSLLGNYCQVRDYQNGILLVEAQSQAVATQLRFTKPQLLGRLRQGQPFQRLTDIEVKVVKPSSATRPRRKLVPNTDVSASNRQMLRDTADHIATDNSKEAKNLASSLQKLAATLDKLGKK